MDEGDRAKFVEEFNSYVTGISKDLTEFKNLIHSFINRKLMAPLSQVSIQYITIQARQKYLSGDKSVLIDLVPNQKDKEEPSPPTISHLSTDLD